MKKLFGHKPKVKPNSGSRDFADEIPRSSPPVATPLYQKLATHGTPIQTIPVHAQSQHKEPTEEDCPQPQQPQQPQQLHHPTPPSINVVPRTQSFGSLPPNKSPKIPSSAPPRSSSPASSVATITNVSISTKATRQPDRDSRKKNQSTAPVALSILRALEPPRAEIKINPTRSQSEERHTVSESGYSHRDRERDVGEKRDAGEKKEKRGFWGGRDKEREKEREREREREIMLQREKDRTGERGGDRLGDRLGERDRDRGREIWREDESTAKLTHMIGFLTATAAEDWTLLMDVCDRASSSESNAKAAIRALRYEFKSGSPAAQLSAARLWFFMLLNSSDIFIYQSTSRKFLDALEELLSSPRTSPVVRERLLEVVAAAAYASGNKKGSRHERDGFRGLWKRVKPSDKPDEGIPFDTDDAMFQPPNTGQGAGYDIPIVSYQESSPLPIDSTPVTPIPAANTKRKSPVRNHIISPDEDMRRLFQECTIGQGNAALLSQALAHSKPEDLKKKEIIKEFYDKCRSSQELIYAQIPWASAGAEHSRAINDKADIARKHTNSTELNLAVDDSGVPVEQTMEEKLLAALLVANADLMEALQQYEDLQRVALERKTEERSRKELRIERKHRDLENLALSELSASNTSSRPSTPRSRPHTPQHPNLVHPLPQHPPSSEADHDPIFIAPSLAPPPAAPHGPRSPAPISLHTRTPSPGTPRVDSYMNGHDVHENIQMPSLNGFNDDYPFAKPSAKALGKRRVVELDNLSDPPDDVDDVYFDKEHPFASGDGADPEFEDENDARRHQPPVHFVYDAVAERMRQRLEGREELVDNRVH
ncbi:hypothetical protein BYT27DRAFT_7204130 [Phlegmacium glaucopus]|nr:hypothetical protein BYT27DRAFT_7204130 [Phlegmacium glaucopus]